MSLFLLPRQPVQRVVGVVHVTRRVLFDRLAFPSHPHEAIVMAGRRTQSVMIERGATLRPQRLGH